jgi:hypothetical protein
MASRHQGDGVGCVVPKSLPELQYAFCWRRKSSTHQSYEFWKRRWSMDGLSCWKLAIRSDLAGRSRLVGVD